MKTQGYQYCYTSEIGTLYLTANDEALTGLFWELQDVPVINDLKQSRILSQAVKELREYLAGGRKQFAVPLDYNGSPFQLKVWNEVKKVPFGKTLSYRDLALKIKNEKAVRAVGTANGRNPLCIFIPCHRIIAADGTLGGYSGGLKIKEKLLKLEKLLERSGS